MPQNLELKCRISSIAVVCETAQALGAAPQGILTQEDTYLVVPHGRMKLRREGTGPLELIVYQRPDRAGDRWSSYQRFSLSHAPGLAEALVRALGVLCVVRKRRHLFLVPDARIHVDEVDHLGTFLEFEVTSEYPAVAERVMAGLRRGFGLEGEGGIPGSYADLILSA
jgi:adenylate cyclase class IV